MWMETSGGVAAGATGATVGTTSVASLRGSGGATWGFILCGIIAVGGGSEGPVSNIFTCHYHRHMLNSRRVTADSWDPEKWRFTAAASSSKLLSIVWHISADAAHLLVHQHQHPPLPPPRVSRPLWMPHKAAQPVPTTAGARAHTTRVGFKIPHNPRSYTAPAETLLAPKLSVSPHICPLSQD